MEQKTNMNFDKYDWPCTFNFTYAQVYSITARGLGQDPSCCFVLTEECVQIPLGHSICYGSEISASQSFGCGAGDYKCSLRIAAQINCIRMEIVFCVPQQVLLERTNFHLGPNSFENVILCSLQYILTNPMNPFVHRIWSVSYIAQCPVWFWACQRLS